MCRRWLSVLLVTMVLVLLVGVLPVSAAPTGRDVIHIVRRGETLNSIARRYGVSVWAIASHNGITNPNRIYVGQRLAIPVSVSPACGGVHVVRPGENLYGIALAYGMEAWPIARASGIRNLNHIYVGQRLSIPCPARVPPEPGLPSPPALWPGPWNGEYFDNAGLGGSPFVTRSDESINFNWGYGVPAGGMPANRFSVRWTGTFGFDEGVYRFYAKIDDGVRVYVDDELIIDGWRAGALRTYTADRALTPGEHSIKVEYYEWIQVARAYFWMKKLSGPVPPPAPSAVPTPGVPPPPPGEGWYGEFFNNKTLDGSPVATQHVGYIGFEWGGGSPMPEVWADGFSARWTTTMHLQTDHYRFCAMSDDGARIWVGSTLVLDEWHPNNGVAYCGAYWADTGDYVVKVEYYEDGGKALIYVWWEPH